MPFATGTADTAVDMQIKLNTHLVANGWTKLHGETDQNAVSPQSARYWRLLIDEPENGADFIEIENLEWRTTLGGANQATTGANYSFSIAPASGTGSDLVSGTTPVRSIDLNDLHWTITYDFGSATTIRELMIKCDTDHEAPSKFWVQWSTDNVTWTTMYESLSVVWSPGDNTTKVFQFDTAYREGMHFSDTRCRRTGGANETTNISEMCNGTFAWEGPGYDASRRVHISCTAFYDITNTVERWKIGGGTSWNVASLTPWNDATVGGDTSETPRMLFPFGPFTYWIYSNSLRVILIVKNGLDDYLSLYMGFLEAFAQPPDYPYPLLLSAASWGDSNLVINNNGLSSMCDPYVLGSARWRDWDGVWQYVGARQSSALSDLYTSSIASWMWPFYQGTAGDGTWPAITSGDNDSFSRHWMEAVVANTQGELPFFPVILSDWDNGNIGAMSGVFATPRGGILSAEQVVTISAVNYRIFTNRNRSKGHNYFAVRED